METLPRQYVSYQDFKQALDSEMTRVAVGFVRIGFLLNYAEETGIIVEGGYNNVNEFALAEYQLEETQVSRFTRIYKNFGIPGEPRLQEQFANHGVAKLGIMLTLPDFINEEISSGYSKSEINAIKREYDAEKKITDIEVMCEEKSTLQQLLPEGFTQLVMQFVKDYPEEYIKIYDAITLDDLKEIMAPNGECVFKIRVPGVGLHLLFAKSNENMVVTNARTGDKETYEWEMFFDALKDYFLMGTDAKDSWSNIFQVPYPESEPVQEDPVKEEKADKNNVKKSKPKKESKVKTPAPKTEKKTEPKPEEPSKEAEEQLPGQKNIMDYPECLPESMKVEYIAPVQESDNASVIRGYKAGIKAALNVAINKCDQNDWSAVIAKATDVVWRAKRIQELEGKD